MLLAATGDIHAPLNLKIFRASLYEIEEKPDIFVLAGDIVDGNNYIYLKKVYQYQILLRVQITTRQQRLEINKVRFFDSL